MQKSFTLRPEATASVCRAYIEHNLQQLPQPVKLYYMGPMFRRERPQKGRYRQFYQFDVEALGYEGPDVDAEQIIMLFRLWKEDLCDKEEVLLKSSKPTELAAKIAQAEKGFFDEDEEGEEGDEDREDDDEDDDEDESPRSKGKPWKK